MIRFNLRFRHPRIEWRLHDGKTILETREHAVSRPRRHGELREGQRYAQYYYRGLGGNSVLVPGYGIHIRQAGTILSLYHTGDGRIRD